MLSKEKKKALRTQAMSLSPILQIGKDGLRESVYADLDIQLEAHELVKCALLKTSPIEVRQAAIECSMHTHSEIVHIIGRTFVLYRKKKKKRPERTL